MLNRFYTSLEVNILVVNRINIGKLKNSARLTIHRTFLLKNILIACCIILPLFSEAAAFHDQSKVIADHINKGIKLFNKRKFDKASYEFNLGINYEPKNAGKKELQLLIYCYQLGISTELIIDSINYDRLSKFPQKCEEAKTIRNERMKLLLQKCDKAIDIIEQFKTENKNLDELTINYCNNEPKKNYF
jgi:hypothetical protein